MLLLHVITLIVSNVWWICGFIKGQENEEIMQKAETKQKRFSFLYVGCRVYITYRYSSEMKIKRIT